jgi:hypothetical protein
MPKVAVPIIKGDKIGVETEYRDSLPVNMYAVKHEILGAVGYMISYPGIELYAGIATDKGGGDRGGVYNERFGKHYRLSGEYFFEINAAGSTIALGTIPGTSQASFPYSFNTQAIIAGGNMYLYDPTNGFRQVTDPNVGHPLDGVWIDGYYLLTDGDYLYHTTLIDESVIDINSYATAEFMPDESMALARTQDNNVLVFGQYTTEPFVNVATANFAFQRIDKRSLKVGIVSTHSKCESNGKFYILGGGKNQTISVLIVTIGGAEKISTREIDKIINSYSISDLSDVRLESRTQNDTVFVVIHLPNHTICFNESIAVSMGKDVAWSILRSGTEEPAYYKYINGIFDPRYSEWLFGDRDGTNIYKMNNLISSQRGVQTEHELPTPFVNLETLSINSLELKTIPGYVISDDASVAMSITTDGVTYGTEWHQLYSNPNEYQRRFIINRLGYVRHWIGFKFRCVTESRLSFALMEIDCA